MNLNLYYTVKIRIDTKVYISRHTVLVFKISIILNHWNLSFTTRLEQSFSFFVILVKDF